MRKLNIKLEDNLFIRVLMTCIFAIIFSLYSPFYIIQYIIAAIYSIITGHKTVKILNVKFQFS